MTLAHKNGLEHAATEETDRTLNKLKNRRVSYERSEIFEGIIAILGVSALVALTGSAEGTGLLYAGSIIVTVASVIEFIAGIKGLGACKMPQKADACIKLGIIIAVLSIVSMIVNVVGGGEFNVTSLILNLLVPGAYVYGAIQMKKDSQG